jgi:hypothetical protein
MLPLHFAAFASYPCLEPLLIANDDLSESVNKEDPLLDIQCADQDLRESVTREDPGRSTATSSWQFPEY